MRGLLSDNGGNDRSTAVRAVVLRHGLEHRRTRPDTPGTNGKAEHGIRPLLHEWAYVQAYHMSAPLPRFLYYFTTQRKPFGLNGQTPTQRLAQVL